MAKVKKGSNAPFPGGSKSISYIGDRVYAFSGTYDASTNQQTVLDFDTSEGYINAIWNLTQFVREDSVGSTESTVATISFNGIIIYQVMVGSSAVDSPTSQTVEMIIPPLTKVSVTLRSGTTAATRQATVLMIGRVYE
mgnify:CR=1 FL=1|jgi:hypothetical protein